MEYKLLGEGVLALRRSLGEIRDAEAIIFDCDGTIIDSKESYYLADKAVACIILEQLYGLKCYLGKDLDDAIAELEMLGGFNNDWHKTSLIIQALLLHSGTRERIRRDLAPIGQVEDYLERCFVEDSYPPDVKAGVKWLAEKASCNYGRFMSLADFEELVDMEAERLGKADQVRDFRAVSGPLTEYGSSLLTTLYEEVFLGEQGVRKRYGVDPSYVSWKGMLDREKIMISRETLEKLEKLVPKGLAIATGRGRWETEKTLKPLLEYFDLEASIFSAEFPGLFEKPSARMLVECSRRLSASKIIYVGNSFEDLLLVKNSRKKGVKALFVGVLTNPHALDLFMRNKADAIIDEVNLLPKVLEKEEIFWRPF